MATHPKIGLTFNVGKITVINTVQDVARALYELRDDHIKFSKNFVEITSSIQSFEELSVLPNIKGLLDGSHVGIQAPPDRTIDYFS